MKKLKKTTRQNTLNIKLKNKIDIEKALIEIFKKINRKILIKIAEKENDFKK